MSIDRVLDALKRARLDPRQQGDSWSARCPIHDDRTPSLSISKGRDGRVLVFCHVCTDTATPQIVAALGLELADLMPEQRRRAGEISATYDYVSEDGEILFQVVRYDPKAFKQRRPDGTGGWTWKLGDVRRVLYRLPEVLAAAATGGTVYLVEGEKDADSLALRGYVATTSPGGASKRGSKWRADYTESLKGVELVRIVGDKDEAGIAHAQAIAAALTHAGLAVELLLPAAGKDVADHLAAGLTVSDLVPMDMPAELPPDPFSEAETADLVQKFFDTDKPILHADDPDLDRVSRAAWDVVQTTNVNPVTIFRVGSVPSRLERDDDGAPVLRALTVERLRQEMAVRACWYKGFGLEALFSKLVDLAIGDEEWGELHKKNSTARPPRDVIQNMLAMPDIGLPVLERIVEAPVFGPAGNVETRPGYHAASRTFYAGGGLELAPVSADPSPTEVKRAVDVLGELLEDFPFTSTADQLIAIAAMLGPFARGLIDGPTPLHLFEAPTPGTGKGLLADVIAIPSTGRRAATITEARGEEEWRKRITAVLRNGRALTLIDNVQARLDSAALSAAITSPMWTDRLLGGNDIVSYPVRTTWIATGNNPALSREIARRTVRCRMDAGVDHPESREGFRHPLPDWAYTHRGEIVWACLTLIQNWIAAGRPPWKGTPLGSLESWCRTLGGVFDEADLTGFLENLEDFRESSDEESSMWSAFLGKWWASHADGEVSGSELFPLGREVLDLGSGTTRAQQTTLGQLLSYQRDRWYGDLQIVRCGISDGRRRWRLHKRSVGR